MSFFGLFGTPDIEKLRAKKDIERLIKVLLDGKDPDVRKRAIIALGELRDERATDALSSVLGISFLQNESLEALLKIEDPAVIKPLLSVLGRSPDKGDTRRMVIELAKSKRYNITGYLREVLNDRTTRYQKIDKKVAVKTLVEIGDPSVIPDLINVMDSRSADGFDDDPELRRTVLRALAEIGDPRSVDVLAVLLEDRDPEIRQIALEAIQKIGGKPAIQALRVALRTENADVRRSAAKLLAKIAGFTALDDMIALLEDQDPEISEIAVESLRNIGGRAGIQALYGVLRTEGSENSRLRRSAARALVQIVTVHNLKEIASLLQDPDPEVGKTAVEGLRHIGGSFVMPALCSALHVRDLDVRRSAARVLAEAGDASTLEEILALIKDDDVDLRKSAVEALKNIGGEQVIQPLVTALGDRYQTVRWEAWLALRKLSWQPKTDVELVISKIVGGYYSELDYKDIAKCGEVAVSALVNVLQDKTVADISKVAKVLHKLGWRPDPKIVKTEAAIRFWIVNDEWEECIKAGQLVIEPILEGYEDNDEYPEERARVLSEISTAQSISLLLGKARDQAFRSPITRAIMDAIQEVLERESSQIRLEDLQDLAGLEDLGKIYRWKEFDTHEQLDFDENTTRVITVTETIYHEMIGQIDNSQIRELAKHELERRVSKS